MKVALRSRPARRGRGAAPLVFVAVLGSASAAGAAGFKISEKLTATAAAPGARGRAVIVVRDSDRKVRVAARGLQRSTTHDVILDRVKIGTLTTSGRGSGRARFGSRPHTHDDQFLGTDPRGKTLILRRADAADVLVAHIPGSRNPTPGDPSDDLIRCCLPKDEGTECENRAVDECAARGGVDMGAGSCLPNPCSGAARGAGVICCVSDESGTQCEDRTEAECAARGGTAVSPTRCTTTPCAPLPPAGPEIQCCMPANDGGAECEIRTADECAARGGSDVGAGTCEPDPCSGSGEGSASGDGSGRSGGSGGPGRR